MSTFILAPGDPPPSDPLNLLPFALTPLPAHAAIGTYFRPRPTPQGQVAAFRGRQVVGQSIAVPRGYRGVVLRVPPAGAPVRGGPGVLTPATSFASSASGSRRQSTPAELDTADLDAASPRAQRAAARARGSGQVAVARPRRRAAPRKRIRLDESDEEDADNADMVPAMKRMQPEPSRSGVGEGEREQEGQVGLVATAEGDMDDDEGAPEIVLAPAPPTTAPTTSAPTCTSATAAAVVPADTRVLVPTASFGSIVLWTPDAPLAGFDPSELCGATEKSVKVEGAKTETETETGTPSTTATTGADATDTDAADGPDGSKPDAAAATPVTALERGWWRTGGAGEGGDEFVRALGEWLGLGEVIHKPLYADDDDEDE